MAKSPRGGPPERVVLLHALLPIFVLDPEVQPRSPRPASTRVPQGTWSIYEGLGRNWDQRERHLDVLQGSSRPRIGPDWCSIQVDFRFCIQTRTLDMGKHNMRLPESEECGRIRPVTQLQVDRRIVDIRLLHQTLS